MVEHESAVVDTDQTALEAIIRTGDAGLHLAAVANGHVKRVHAVVDALSDELRKHHGRLAVQCRVAQVVLSGGGERGVDDELFGRLVVGRGGADAGHVRAVTGLGHRKDAGNLEAHDAGQPFVVVRLGAEVQHGGTEQTPLHARLDLAARITKDEFFECRDVSTVVVLTTEVDRERPVDLSVLHQQLELFEHACAVLVHRQAFNLGHFRASGERAGCQTGIGPSAEQHLSDGFGVERGCATGSDRLGDLRKGFSSRHSDSFAPTLGSVILIAEPTGCCNKRQRIQPRSNCASHTSRPARIQIPLTARPS